MLEDGENPLGKPGNVIRSQAVQSLQATLKIFVFILKAAAGLKQEFWHDKV